LVAPGADGILFIMPRFWLTYRQEGRLLGVVIVDAPSALRGRKKFAATKGIATARFTSATELRGEFAALIPASAIGRTLGPVEASRLIAKFRRGIEKIR
jgi:hypothetical protein